MPTAALTVRRDTAKGMLAVAGVLLVLSALVYVAVGLASFWYGGVAGVASASCGGGCPTNQTSSLVASVPYIVPLLEWLTLIIGVLYAFAAFLMFWTPGTGSSKRSYKMWGLALASVLTFLGVLFALVSLWVAPTFLLFGLAMLAFPGITFIFLVLGRNAAY